MWVAYVLQFKRIYYLRFTLVALTQKLLPRSLPMNIKHLSPLIVASTIVLGATPSFAESTSNSNATFFCEVNDGVPITVAKNAEGETVSFFHWNNSSVLKQQSNPQQLCNSVSSKLNNYSQNTNSAPIFRAYEQAGLPTICVSSSENTCDSILFTLEPTENPLNTANEVLVSILDKNLQNNPVQSTVDRGLQSTSYKVDFWTLLGLKLFK